jgi:hypothetical protein
LISAKKSEKLYLFIGLAYKNAGIAVLIGGIFASPSVLGA